MKLHLFKKASESILKKKYSEEYVTEKDGEMKDFCVSSLREIKEDGLYKCMMKSGCEFHIK